MASLVSGYSSDDDDHEDRDSKASAGTAGDLASAKASTDGAARSSVPLTVGDACTYTDAAGLAQRVTVLKVHFDDPPEPYYTVQIQGGRERATTRDRLAPLERFAPLEAGPLETVSMWYYEDDTRTPQGPFGPPQMREWFLAGWLQCTTAVAPSYYGEVPAHFWSVSVLWEEPAEEAFARPPPSGAERGLSGGSGSHCGGVEEHGGVGGAPEGGEAGDREPGPQHSGQHWREWSAATRVAQLEGGEERRAKFLGLLGANKRQKA